MADYEATFSRVGKLVIRHRRLFPQLIAVRFPALPRLLLVLALGAVVGAVARAAATNVVPVARWDFGVEEATPLIAHGGVHRDQPGPRPPTFPDFDASYLPFFQFGLTLGKYFDFVGNTNRLIIKSMIEIHDDKAMAKINISSNACGIAPR